jgi:hypothetical protein
LVVNAMTEEAALTSMQKRVDRAAKGFRRVGVMSFWTQLTLTVVSSVIIVFAILYRTATQVTCNPYAIHNSFLKHAHAFLGLRIVTDYGVGL